ncbi:unnamed protein product [Trichogramma brassicae]|uniref:Uncharacterized protein n=1 Tax=Trichogramma brassicae TaxID=86971 RepID=A0A6H5J2P9_9HYME|nr:unnamed protein product [Trichogramma brassicae]
MSEGDCSVARDAAVSSPYVVGDLLAIKAFLKYTLSYGTRLPGACVCCINNIIIRPTAPALFPNLGSLCTWADDKKLAHDARAQAATSSTRAQTALSTGGRPRSRASRERTREDIPPKWTHTTQPSRIRERCNQPSRRKHAQTRRKMKGYRQRAYAQMKGQPLTHVRLDERAPQASARPTASYPASTHEPVGPLIDKRHRRMQVQTRKPNSAAAPTRPLLRLLTFKFNCKAIVHIVLTQDLQSLCIEDLNLTTTVIMVQSQNTLIVVLSMSGFSTPATRAQIATKVTATMCDARSEMPLTRTQSPPLQIHALLEHCTSKVHTYLQD